MRKKTATLTNRIAAVEQRPLAACMAVEPSRNGELISEDAIRQLAYQKWEVAGKPAGDGVQFWLGAEQELNHK